MRYKTVKKMPFALLLLSCIGFGNLKAQNPNIILGRPTDTSITARILFDQNVSFYIEYGTTTANYTRTSKTFNNVANTPFEIDLNNLFPDTKY